MSDTPVNANIIPAGQIVIVHCRWSYEHGPQDCLGVFRAVRSFDPTAEQHAFTAAYPGYGPPERWSPKDRVDWALWAVEVAGIMEDATPTYLFLEPWPEKPDSMRVKQAMTEDHSEQRQCDTVPHAPNIDAKVAHGD